MTKIYYCRNLPAGPRLRSERSLRQGSVPRPLHPAGQLRPQRPVQRGGAQEAVRLPAGLHRQPGGGVRQDTLNLLQVKQK